MVDVIEFLHPLSVVSNIEIVIASLPEVFRIADQPPRYSLLQRLQRFRQGAALRLADQKMNVFRHDNIPVQAKPEASAHALQSRFEGSFCQIVCEQRLTMVAGEGNKVAVSGLLKTAQSPRHRLSLRSTNCPTQAKTGLEWATRPARTMLRE